MKYFFKHKQLITFFFIFSFISPLNSFAALKLMTEKELDKISAFGFTHFSIDGNTMRLGIDIHIEQFTKIDSLKLGYYYREDLSTTKYSILGSSSFNNELCDIAPFFNNPQGNGNNENYIDWDINWENVQMGKSPEEPLTIDGLVIRLVYDDINSKDRKLEELIIGSNAFTGYFNAEGTMHRSTGIFNPDDVNDEGVDAGSWLSRLARHPNHPIYLKRDSFLSHFHYKFNHEDGDTGQWLIIGSPTSEHKGFSVITGYKEDTLNYYYNERVTNYATTDGLKNLWDYENLL